MATTRFATFLACLMLWVLACTPAFAQRLVVGGKDFTEQRLIVELTAQLLRAKGYDVQTRSGLSSSGLRRELESGLVDLSWEYTGTSLVTFNNITEKLSPEDAYWRVKDLDARKGLIWLAPSRVDNTYALAMRRTEAREKGIRSISDLAARMRRGERFKLACNTEFYIRADGLMPLQRQYGFEFARQNVVRMGTGAVYDTLRDSPDINVGLVFATDGRITSYDLLILEDDRGFFPSYLLTPVVSQKVLDLRPDLAVHLEALAAKLDNATMAGLNGMVDVQKRSVEEVASSFLNGAGLR